MDTLTLFLGSSFSVVLVAGLKFVIKKLFKKETPTLGALALLFVVAIFVASGIYYWDFLAPETKIAMTQVWGLAIILYDFFVKAVWQDGSAIIKKLFGK